MRFNNRYNARCEKDASIEFPVRAWQTAAIFEHHEDGDRYKARVFCPLCKVIEVQSVPEQTAKLLDVAGAKVVKIDLVKIKQTEGIPADGEIDLGAAQIFLQETSDIVAVAEKGLES